MEIRYLICIFDRRKLNIIIIFTNETVSCHWIIQSYTNMQFKLEVNSYKYIDEINIINIY